MDLSRRENQRTVVASDRRRYPSYLMHLREMHFVHDPSASHVSFAILSERGGELIKWTGQGHYRSDREPRFELSIDEDIPDAAAEFLDDAIVSIRRRAQLKLEAGWNEEQFVIHTSLPDGATLVPDIQKAEDDANFWFRVAVNTAMRAGAECPRCEHRIGVHWPDDERQKPGCHAADDGHGCRCSYSPQEILTLSEAAMIARGGSDG